MSHLDYRGTGYSVYTVYMDIYVCTVYMDIPNRKIKHTTRVLKKIKQWPMPLKLIL